MARDTIILADDAGVSGWDTRGTDAGTAARLVTEGIGEAGVTPGSSRTAARCSTRQPADR